MTDTYFSVQNEGAVTTVYTSTRSSLLCPRTHSSRSLSQRYSAPGTTGCNLQQTPSLQTVADVSSGISGAHTSFTLGPIEKALVTLRALCAPATAGQPCYDPDESLSIAVKSQAPNCTTAGCETDPDTGEIIVPGEVITRRLPLSR